MDTDLSYSTICALSEASFQPYESFQAYRNQIGLVDQLVVAFCIDLKNSGVFAVDALPMGLGGQENQGEGGQEALRDHLEHTQMCRATARSVKRYMHNASKDDT